MTLTVAQVLEHVETDLTDDAIQRLIDDADKHIERVVGPTTRTEVKDPSGQKTLFTTYPISAITSIKERRTLEAEQITLTVTDDYRKVDEFRIVRVGLTWGKEVEIVYTVSREQAEMDRVLIDLVKLAVQYEGIESEEKGDYSADFLDYEKERGRILARLSRGSLVT